MKVSFLGNEYLLDDKKLLKVGDVLADFKALNSAFSNVDTKKYKYKKIFLSIPSITTSVCSKEILQFAELLKDKPIMVFVVSFDLPFHISIWKSKNNFNYKNFLLLSDIKYRSFSKNTSTIIKELGILARTVIITDENNVISYVEYLNELTDEPNYTEVLKML